jgi:hypothetical protein
MPASESKSSQPNIQDVFLNYVRREKLVVVIRMMDASEARGADQELRPLRPDSRSGRHRPHDLQARDRRHQDAEGRLNYFRTSRRRDVPSVAVHPRHRHRHGQRRIDELPDASTYGDQGATPSAISRGKIPLRIPTLRSPA